MKDVRFIYFRVPPWYLKTKSKPKWLYPYRRGAGYQLYNNVNPRGGMVICQLMWGDAIFVEGKAICSMSDNFNYKIGREMAYGRALKKAQARLEEIARDNAEEIEGGINPFARTDLVGSSEWEKRGWRVEQRGSNRTFYPPVWP